LVKLNEKREIVLPDSANASKFRIIYFNGRGKAEFLRYLLAYAGQPFEDIRLTLDEWKVMKQYSGFQELPVLKFSEQNWLTNSLEIARYLADKFNLAGTNFDETFEAEQLVQSVYVCYEKMYWVVRAALAHNDKGRKEAWEGFKYDYFLSMMDTWLAKLHKNDSGWLVGVQPTWADFAIAELMDRCETCFDLFALKDYYPLHLHAEKVQRLPGVKEWIDKRPRTVY